MASAGLIWLAAGLGAAALLSQLLLHVAQRRAWLAQPNRRSFHQVATPTSGGLAFAAPISLYLAFAAQEAPLASGWAAAGAGLALLGWVDDRRELGRGLRLGGQLLAVLLTLWWFRLDWPWWGWALAALLMLWHINLCNFMDGIDGLAAAQCLFFCLAALWLAGDLPGWQARLLWLTAGAMLGFLAYNWPARIFMGDAGSLYIGLLTGGLFLLAFVDGQAPLAAGAILLTGFWFDASYTLCVRIATGQAFLEAHRSHLYQKLAARHGKLRTTAAFAAFCACWLLPLAWAAAAWPGWGAPLLLLAALPLALAAWRLRAGLPERKME